MNFDFFPATCQPCSGCGERSREQNGGKHLLLCVFLAGEVNGQLSPEITHTLDNFRAGLLGGHMQVVMMDRDRRGSLGSKVRKGHSSSAGDKRSIWKDSKDLNSGMKS